MLPVTFFFKVRAGVLKLECASEAPQSFCVGRSGAESTDVHFCLISQWYQCCSCGDHPWRTTACRFVLPQYLSWCLSFGLNVLLSVNLFLASILLKLSCPQVLVGVWFTWKTCWCCRFLIGPHWFLASTVDVTAGGSWTVICEVLDLQGDHVLLIVRTVCFLYYSALLSLSLSYQNP